MLLGRCRLLLLANDGDGLHIVITVLVGEDHPRSKLVSDLPGGGGGRIEGRMEGRGGRDRGEEGRREEGRGEGGRRERGVCMCECLSHTINYMVILCIIIGVAMVFQHTLSN